MTPGLGGLATVPPVLQGMDVVESTEHSLTIKATLVVWNPSNITAALGDLSFLWSYNSHLIGVATVPDANFRPGHNTVECIGMVDPATDCTHKHDSECDPELAKSAMRQFISKYISGKTTTCSPTITTSWRLLGTSLQLAETAIDLRSYFPTNR